MDRLVYRCARVRTHSLDIGARGRGRGDLYELSIPKSGKNRVNLI